MSHTSSKEVQRIKVITSAQRRRRWSMAEKIRIVQECKQPGMSSYYVARKHDIAPNMLFRWRKLIREGGLSVISANERIICATEIKQLQSRIRELEQLLGKKTMVVEILR